MLRAAMRLNNSFGQRWRAGGGPEKQPGGQPVHRNAERETLADIDRRLHHIINTLGWPTWNTAHHRSGGQVPAQTEHYFGQHALDKGARIDLHRGIVSDDFHNNKWKRWLDAMPLYRAEIVRSRNPKRLDHLADSMEIAVGLAYAAHTREAYLPGQLIYPRGTVEDNREAWSAVWVLFTSLGVQATVRVPPGTRGGSLAAAPSEPAPGAPPP